MSLWGSCSPSDCEWGEAEAETRTVGTRTYVYAQYHHGFATRYVYADMSLYLSGQLWIWMWIQLRRPGPRGLRVPGLVPEGVRPMTPKDGCSGQRPAGEILADRDGLCSPGSLRRLEEPRPHRKDDEGRLLAMAADTEPRRPPKQPFLLEEPERGAPAK